MRNGISKDLKRSIEKHYQLVAFLGLFTLSVLFYLIYEGFKGYKEYFHIVSIGLFEVALVSVLFERVLSRYEERRREEMERWIEHERREGRKYKVRSKTMKFRIEDGVLRFRETLEITPDPDVSEIQYQVYYDIAEEIKHPAIGEDCPRVRVAAVRGNGNTITILDSREQSSNCRINKSVMTCVLTVKVPRDTEIIKLEIDRCYRLEELADTFTRMIQDPVEKVNIDLDKTFIKEMGLDMESGNIEEFIKLYDFNQNIMNPLFDVRASKSGENIRITIDPIDPLRNRFFIMDKITIALPNRRKENEAMGAS